MRTILCYNISGVTINGGRLAFLIRKAPKLPVDIDHNPKGNLTTGGLVAVSTFEILVVVLMVIEIVVELLIR